MKDFSVYIMASGRIGTLYIGVTSDLERRVQEHKNNEIEGFTEKYLINKLVYYETCSSAKDAIAREKQLKNWHRNWKVTLIEKDNPRWEDLFSKVVDPESSSG